MFSGPRARVRDVLATWGVRAGMTAAGIAAGACANAVDPNGGSGHGSSSGAASTGGSFDPNAGASASGGAAASGTGGTIGTGAGGMIGTPNSSDGGTGSGGNPGSMDAGTCASESRQGKVFPVDIFVMMDQSGSMLDKVAGPNGTMAVKWDLLKQAFTTFVNDPKSAGIGIGIQYFPIPNIDNSSCDAGTYAVTHAPNAPPSGIGVDIAPLPGNAAAITSSLNAHTPGGQTPTVPALTGALDYAKTWANQNPTHKVVVVMATDGAPHGCTNNTIAVAAGVAQAAAAGTPAIPTYVIGIGDSLAALNQIAQGGGTAPALIVSPGQDVAMQFLDAMNKIRSSALVPCVLTIPSSDGGPVDFGKVNVVDIRSDGGAPLDFLQVPEGGLCNATTGGWFYDNAAAPTSINLCPASCNLVTGDMTDQVDILLGCATLVAPPPK